ncbi:MAG: response regulator transcription factor [Actinomycetota bacterium]|nr:response regulator transcription factor [Actinomycetota bacterium]
MTIRVVLVDDQALIRAGFRAIIDSADDLEVVAEVDDGATAVEVVRDARADVVLMDIRMPGRVGIETTRVITADEDLAGVRVIVLTTFELDEYVVAAMAAGASGFLDKGVEPATLLDAIRVVAAGDALLTPRATRALLASIEAPASGRAIDEAAVSALTAREREVVGLVGRGLSNDEIAETLYLSPLTAKTHVSRAMTKLAARDRAQLVVLAFRTGLTQLDDL